MGSNVGEGSPAFPHHSSSLRGWAGPCQHHAHASCAEEWGAGVEKPRPRRAAAAGAVGLLG